MAEIPFGTPPVGFMQTGNQPFETPPVSVDTPFGETSAPSADQPPVGVTASVDSFAPGASDMNPFNNSEFGAPPVTTPQNKYNIIDLFWLINPKFYANPRQQPGAQEAHFVILSFNIDFGNLRCSFFNLTNNSIQGNIVYLENLKRLVAGTIYPATAFNICNSTRLATTCIEQLFKQIPGATWQQERPVCIVEKNEEKIRFGVKDPKNGSYFYDFVGWQKDAFLHACNFVYTKGFDLFAQQHLK